MTLPQPAAAETEPSFALAAARPPLFGLPIWAAAMPLLGLAALLAGKPAALPLIALLFVVLGGVILAAV